MFVYLCDNFLRSFTKRDYRTVRNRFHLYTLYCRYEPYLLTRQGGADSREVQVSWLFEPLRPALLPSFLPTRLVYE